MLGWWVWGSESVRLAGAKALPQWHGCQRADRRIELGDTKVRDQELKATKVDS